MTRIIQKAHEPRHPPRSLNWYFADEIHSFGQVPTWLNSKSDIYDSTDIFTNIMFLTFQNFLIINHINISTRAAEKNADPVLSLNLSPKYRLYSPISIEIFAAVTLVRLISLSFIPLHIISC